jgi:DNA-binding MarR family transcriptional regulator
MSSARKKTEAPGTTAAGTAAPLRLRDQAHMSAQQHQALNPSSLLVVLALYRAFAVLDRDQAEEIATIGLNVTQFNILMSLHRLGRPLSMGELATLLVVRPTNLSGIMNSLAERALVRREINADDQRSLMARITPAGEKLLAGFAPGHGTHLDRLMQDLPESDRAQLVELLRRLIQSISHAQNTATRPTRRRPPDKPLATPRTGYRAAARRTPQASR